MEKVQYDKQPLKLEAVGNGSFLYRWDIKEVSRTEPDGAENKIWECYEALAWKNDRTEVTRAAINVLRENADNEAKLINDYNAAVAGVLDVSYKQPYLDYIAARDALKKDIKDYFASL